MTAKTNKDKSTNSVPVRPSNQTTILPYIQKFTAIKRAQLTRKFQLAYFTATTGNLMKTLRDLKKRIIMLILVLFIAMINQEQKFRCTLVLVNVSRILLSH